MPTNTITIAPEVKASKTFSPLVERASVWLNEDLATLNEPVQAEWTRVDNSPGEEMVALTLRDPQGSWTRLFRKRHLEDRAEAEHEFNGLMRSLLRTHTHFLLKKMQESGATSGE